MVSIGPCIFSVVYIVPHPARDNPPPNCKQCVLAESNAITKKLAAYKNLPVTEVNYREKEKTKTLQAPKKGLQRCFLASQRGFEPPAPRLGGVCSIQLSY